MSTQRINLARLAGDPLPGDVVLRYDADGNSFYIYPGGFDKYSIREVPGWRWFIDSWILPTDGDTVRILADEFPGVLSIDESAVEKVSQLLGYDPCDRVRGRAPLSGMVGGVVLSDIEVDLEDLEMFEHEGSDEEDENESEREKVTGDVYGFMQQNTTILREQLQVLSEYVSILSSIDNRMGTLEAQVKFLQERATIDTAKTQLFDTSDGALLSELQAVIPDFERLSEKTQLILKDMCWLRQLLKHHSRTDWTPLVTCCDRALEHEANTKVLEPLMRLARGSFRDRFFEDRRLAFGLGLSGRRDPRFNDLRLLLRAVSGQDGNINREDRAILIEIFESKYPGQSSALQKLSQEIEQHWWAYRNNAAHDGFIAAPQATLAMDEVTGRRGRPGLLSMVLALTEVALEGTEHT